MKKCIDCDNEHITQSPRCSNCRSIRRKLTRLKNKAKNQYHKKPKAVYTRYKSGANRRNLEFNLTYEEFLTFWQTVCYYCDDYLETVGLDRVDNNKGYILSNIKPCCTTCNFMKRSQSETEFITKCKAIATKCG